MFAVTVKFRIATGKIDTFLPLMRENARRSLEVEPGCVQFDICRDPERPDDVFLYELYHSAQAFQEHLASPHFKAFDTAVAPMLAEKRVRRFSEVIQ